MVLMVHTCCFVLLTINLNPATNELVKCNYPTDCSTLRSFRNHKLMDFSVVNGNCSGNECCNSIIACKWCEIYSVFHYRNVLGLCML